MTDTDQGLDAETVAWFTSLDPDEQAEFLELLEEAVGPQWELSPKQTYAETLWHKCDWMLYGGAAGGGKTELMIKHANDLSMQVPTHSTLVLRQSIPELRRSIILRLKARLVQFRLPGKLRKVDGVTQFSYSNDSLIECGYCATDEHVANYLSAEYDLMLIDEASLMTPDQITQLSSRLRTTKRKARLGARPHLGLFSNPGGPAHAWLHEVFVSATDYGRQLVVLDITNGIEHPHVTRTYQAPHAPDGATDEQLQALTDWAEMLTIEVDPQRELVVGFVPAKASDNPHIDPSYMKYLNALPERRRRQLRDGDWDTFEGQYFYEWNRDIHIVPWFEIPEGWQHARGIDFGSTAPWACLYGAWDNDGNCYLYDECYAAGLTPAEQAAQAKDKQTRVLSNGRTVKVNYFATLADPSVFADKRGTGRSIADLWRSAGLSVNRAKNARVAGWQNVRQYLMDQESGKPRLFVLEGRCPNLVRTLPLMQHDKKHNEDLDTRLEDHACLAPWTMITTWRGQVRIDEVCVGDLVVTRQGWQRVGWVGVTGHQPLVRVAGVDCTDDHEFWTDNRGWVSAHSVTHSDTLRRCSTTTPWLLARRFRNTAASATTCAGSTFSTMVPASTVASGPTSTAASPRGTTSTTSTMIGPTTDSPTSTSCWDSTTSPSTRRTRPRRALRTTLRQFLGWLRPTQNSQQNSDRTPPSADGLSSESMRSPAKSAGRRHPRRFRRAPSSVDSTARCPHYAPVAEPLGMSSDVWNLVIDGSAHEFYANDILVHNCDALRYLLSARPIGAHAPEPKVGMTLEGRFNKMLHQLDRRPRAKLFN